MDFTEQLTNQKYFLRTSIDNFVYNEIESIRIATTIRVLIHDTKSSTSLLNHLGSKAMDYYDTKAPKDAFAYFNISGLLSVNVNYDDYVTFTPYTGLVAKDIMQVDDKLVMRYKPIFHQKYELDCVPKVDFDSWWNGEIYDNRNGITLTRKELVLIAANKDGGAHVESNLPPKYQAIKNENFIELRVNFQKESFENVPLYSSICQIGWELLKSIEIIEHSH